MTDIHRDSTTQLRVRRTGIDTYQEPVIFMHRDCSIGRAEGLEAQARVLVTFGEREAIATLHLVSDDWLGLHDAGLSNAAWARLGAKEGDVIHVGHAPVVESMSQVRGKIYGQRLSLAALSQIIGDVAAGRYSDLHLAAFIAACAGDRLDVTETIDLTRAMVAAGDRLTWPQVRVVDKHCVGGLPGNRTTPLVVAIVAAAGLTIPKTSSRAITSPAGTADTMETLAPVNLDVPAMRRVVDREGGCVVWGGAMRLSPADDALIRVERPLELDSEGQLVASVLSKKIAAGSTHVLVDLPIGPTAKVRGEAAAQTLSRRLQEVGAALGIEVRCLATDGIQPVGRGIGPALEAHDVLAVLHGDSSAPPDLRERAILLAGHILEIGAKARVGEGALRARRILEDGSAGRKFEAICDAQGGARTPGRARLTHEIVADRAGSIGSIDNRRLARVAKLAGAPRTAEAGLYLHVRAGDRIERGAPIYTIHAQSPGELQYALSHAQAQAPIAIEEAP